MNDDLAPLSARIDRTNELLTRMLAEVAKTPSTHAIFVDAGYLYAAAGRLVAGDRGPSRLRPRRRGPDRGPHRPGPHHLRGQQTAEGLLVRRRETPHPHLGTAVHRRTPRREGPVGQPQRQQPAEGRRLADPLRPGVPGPAPRDQRRGPPGRRRGPGLGGRGGPGLRRPRAPVGHRGTGGPQPGGTAPLGGRQPAHPRPRLLQAVRLPAGGRALRVDDHPTRPRRRPFRGCADRSEVARGAGRAALQELLPGHPYLPGSVDQDLLVEAEGLLQYSLRGQADLRRALRDGFWEHLQGQY